VSVLNRFTVLASVLITVALACRCGGSVTAPATCDGETTVTLTCTPSGSDLACHAVYALIPIGLGAECNVHDVTSQTLWVSSNPSVAAFDVPTAGYLRVLASGQVIITAPSAVTNLGALYPANGLGFVVALGSAAQQMVDLLVLVEDSITGKRLTGASIQVVPSQGPAGCLTVNGNCDVWFLPVSSVTVFATAAGYQPGSATRALMPNNQTMYVSEVTIKLTPQSP
jgi:hypothetical protein